VNDSSTGALYAIAAYGVWGLTPLYWKAVEQVPPPELLGQRILWSCAVGVLLVSAARAWPQIGRCLGTPREGLPILLASLLLASNWLVFLWAVATDRVLATSLGYYVTPLVNVALGVGFLGERLSRGQLAALALATLGVVTLAVRLDEPPWIALALAGSFGCYGLVRKQARVDPIAGFGLEMLLLAPCAAVYLLALSADGGAELPDVTPRVQALVAGSGVVTAAPLLWFNHAARRLRLSTLGFFQYLAPSVAFALAVFAFGEPFTPAHAFSFGCVWLALGIYSLDALHRSSGRYPRPPEVSQ
jgi:chloramphenicol-sensitive protein RarD